MIILYGLIICDFIGNAVQFNTDKRRDALLCVSTVRATYYLCKMHIL